MPTWQSWMDGKGGLKRAVSLGSLRDTKKHLLSQVLFLSREGELSWLSLWESWIRPEAED